MGGLDSGGVDAVAEGEDEALIASVVEDICAAVERASGGAAG